MGMATWTGTSLTAGPWWANWVPPGYVPPVRRPRCGHCGRFIGDSDEAFDRHVDEECPVGGIFHNGVLRGAKRSNGRRSGRESP